MNQSRSNLRQALRSLRNSFSAATRTELDKAIGGHLLALVTSRSAGSIACYLPFDGEPDVAPVYRQLMSHGCRLALPVLKAENGRRMDFHAWRPDTDLVKNRYGILEPQGTGLVAVSSFDMLIMPLVGYDRFGNRLGMGAGYYDRCLETVRGLEIPLRVGLAYSVQEVEPVGPEKWDVPLHGVVNEHGWHTFAHHQP